MGFWVKLLMRVQVKRLCHDLLKQTGAPKELIRSAEKEFIRSMMKNTTSPPKEENLQARRKNKKRLKGNLPNNL